MVRKKGFGYTLEVLIAIAVVFVFTIIIFSSTNFPVSAGTGLIKKQGFEALEYLEKTDELRYLVLSGNKVVLRNRLRELLPPGISLDVDTCSATCSGEIPEKRTVVSLDYYISGYQDRFFTRKVKLWMWGSF